MIRYENGKINYTGEINKNNPYGYMIMEHDYPYDTEVWEAEDYEEAKETLNIILNDNPNRKVYIREITREEVERAANIRAHMM